MESLERLFGKTAEWWSWYQASICSGVVEEAKRQGEITIHQCVDTSEVVEYIIPTSLRRGAYPDRLDLAVDLLFSGGHELAMLAPHAHELDILQRHWRERIQLAHTHLREISHDIAGLKHDMGVALDNQAYDDFVDLILQNRSSAFGSWYGSVGRVALAVQQMGRTLRVFSPAQSADLPGWEYEVDKDRVQKWFHDFEHTHVGKGGPPNHLVDATAIDYLLAVNHALPDNVVLVLLTHSGKIWSVIEQHGGFEDDLMKGDIPLIQPTLTALVTEMRNQSGGSVGWLDFERRVESLVKMRNRIREASSIGPEGASDVEEAANRIDEELNHLEDVSARWQLMERVRLDTREGTGGGAFYEFREAVQNANRKALLKLLDGKIAPILAEMKDLQTSLASAFVPTPAGSISKHLAPLAATQRTRALIRSEATGSVHILRIRGAGPNELLDHIVNAMQRHKAGGGLNYGNRAADLQRLMIECENEAVRDPEYHVLLAAVFFSRRMWFEMHDAASEGLQAYRTIEGEASLPSDDRHVEGELLYASAVGYHRWAMSRPPVGATEVLAVRLNRVTEDCLLSLQCIHEPGGFGVARVYREMASVLGEARTLGASLRRLVMPEFMRWYSDLWDENDLLPVYLELTKRALDASEPGGVFREYFVNTRLYALSDADDDSTVRERESLAKELRTFVNEEPNFFDTMAWHGYRLAKRELNESRQADLLWQAREDIAKAVEPAGGYYGLIFTMHREEIVKEKRNST